MCLLVWDPSEVEPETWKQVVLMAVGVRWEPTGGGGRSG